MCIASPKPPSLPPPPPPPPPPAKPVDPNVQTARSRARREAARRFGAAGTILTSGQGVVGTANIGRSTLGSTIGGTLVPPGSSLLT